ncbi:transporter substrate-binding domain-containing protein [Streptomyces sp. NA04227]|uniref:serine/threonine-protein kinase n=1 Tax=Streptomyces sp. NA04227 TaxID=2742136 RepID=UPI001591A6D2|nr:serine/threonine-protein kinase [Streptomyces sp. NA04227]QKW08848.1 transporter substrate-binding domain-containing protein [Streptomyces sp. NA04227]
MHSQDGAGGGAADGADEGPDAGRAGDDPRRADSGEPQEWPWTPPRAAEPSPGRAQLVIEGRYELLEPIGSGGMGEVWKAHDRRLRRFVAVKGLLDRTAMTSGSQAAAMQRARREAEAIAKIEHQNVVTVHDQVETENQVWIVMKLLEARSLADLLGAERTLAEPKAADIGLQVLQGLRAVHAASVVHRDVKPGNVLVRDDGLAILVDFGIATFEGAAQVTRSGSVIGTPAYLAPELFAPGSAGPNAASDLWALGITLYELVKGRVPFGGGEVWEVQENIRQSPDPDLQGAWLLAPVIQGLLITDPAERLDASTAEVMLREVLAASPTRQAVQAAAAVRPPRTASEPDPGPASEAPGSVEADPDPDASAPAPATPSGKRSPRRRGPWIAAAAALCAALLATTGWLVAKDEKSDAPWKSEHSQLLIGAKKDQPGLSFYDAKTKTWSGYDIDLAYAIGEAMGYERDEVRFFDVTTQNRDDQLWNRDVHLVIASYSITDDRKKGVGDAFPVDFAGPYYAASGGFLVREKSSHAPIRNPGDLIRGHREVCTADDSTYKEDLPREGYTVTKPLPATYQECLDELLDKRSPVYAVASDDVILAGYVKQNPGRVKRLVSTGGSEEYGVAMRPGNPTLKREVCSALREILTGKVWEGIYRKNLSGLLGDDTPPGRPDLTEC